MELLKPSYSAYMVANARAIARAANLAGGSDIESKFSSIADDLEAAMFKYLWAPEQKFFVCEDPSETLRFIKILSSAL